MSGMAEVRLSGGEGEQAMGIRQVVRTIQYEGEKAGSEKGDPEKI